MSREKIILWLFFGSIVAGILLRVIGLGEFEIIGDEPLYIVRALGWVDTLSSDVQTTPYDWFSVLPWWTRLSFHDHPPLVFGIFFIAAKIFGAALATFRYTSALFGIGSIALTYFIGKTLYNKHAGMIASSIVSLNIIAIFYSRVALQESTALFFLLFSFYTFLLQRKNKKYLLLFAFATGLALLAKYVVLFLLPVYAYFIIKERKDYSIKKILVSGIIFFATILPIVVYNAGLYKTVGHFDLQFSSLLHQHTPEWQVLPGKLQRGGLTDRIINLTNIGNLTSPLFLLLVLLSLIFFFLQKEYKNPSIIHVSLAAWLLFLMVSGPAARFLVYGFPLLALLIAKTGIDHAHMMKKHITPLLIVLFVYQLFFSINSTFALNKPGGAYGPKYIAYAPGLYIKDSGVRALDEALSELLDPYVPALEGGTANPIMNAIIKKNVAKKAFPIRPSAQIIFVYDPRSEIRTIMWVYTKHTLYEGWSFFSLNSIKNFWYTNDLSTLKNATFVYIHTTEHTIRTGKEKVAIDPETFLSQIDTHPTSMKRNILTNTGNTAFELRGMSFDTFSLVMTEIAAEEEIEPQIP